MDPLRPLWPHDGILHHEDFNARVMSGYKYNQIEYNVKFLGDQAAQYIVTDSWNENV